jgi:elongation factor Tu
VHDIAAPGSRRDRLGADESTAIPGDSARRRAIIRPMADVPAAVLALPTANVVTIGHFQHGKSTLVAAITHHLAGQEGNATPPRLVRDITRAVGTGRTVPAAIRDLDLDVRAGVTLNPNFVWYHTRHRVYGHHDLPGLRSLLRTTGRCLHQADVAVLVVSAVSSIAPQTREHLVHAARAGVTRFVVYVNQCDLVSDPELLDLVELEVRQLFLGEGLPGNDVPIIRGAALPALAGDPRWAASIGDLLDLLDGEALPPRDDAGPAVLTVDNVYPVLSARGHVAGGLLQRGVLRPGQTVEILGLDNDFSASILELQALREKVPAARAGQHVGLCLAGRQRVRRGQIIAAPGTVKPASKLVCSLTLLGPAEIGARHRVHSGSRPFFYLGPAAVPGRVELAPPQEPIGPRATCASALVELQRPVYAYPGMGLAFVDGCDGRVAHQHRGQVHLWGGTVGIGAVQEIVG